jgi:hypothetical protein
MGLEVVGAGFGRTGTMSLKLALEKLGFDKCYHMMEVMGHPDHPAVWAAAHRGEQVDWDKLFEGYKATVDWPSCNLWREQAAHFPDSKILLSTRDPEHWYASVMNTIYPSSMEAAQSDNEMLQRFGQWAIEIIWDKLFGGRLDDKDHCIRVFLEHEKAVVAEAPPERLLVYEASQGWQPLCDFLGCDVPDEPFPRVNTTEEFQTRRAQISELAQS